MAQDIRSVYSFSTQVVFKPLGEEKGEDAYAYSFERGDLHGQAVFDGCGGAGSWQYPEFRNATGAFIAAQVMAGTFREWLAAFPAGETCMPQDMAESFQEAAGDVVRTLKEASSPMGVSGSMVKAFPCTAGAAVMTLGEDGKLGLTSLCTGDSRVYFLTPKEGLVQMSADDTRGHPDAMESLQRSAPLSDMINADRPFMVKYRHTRLELPCAVLCATDGVFGYLRSPMDFEYLLLKHLVQAETPADFEAGFGNAVRLVTGDDSTCLISFYGWDSFEGVRSAFEERFRYAADLVDRINRAGSPEDTEAAMRQIWGAYKKQTVLDEMAAQGLNNTRFMESVTGSFSGRNAGFFSNGSCRICKHCGSPMEPGPLCTYCGNVNLLSGQSMELLALLERSSKTTANGNKMRKRRNGSGRAGAPKTGPDEAKP